MTDLRHQQRLEDRHSISEQHQVRRCVVAVLSAVIGFFALATAASAADAMHRCTPAEISSRFGHGELRLRSLQPQYHYLADFRPDGTFTITRNYADQFNNGQTANVGPNRPLIPTLSGFGLWSQSGATIQTSFIRPTQLNTKLVLSDYAPELLRISELRCAGDSNMLVVFSSGDMAAVIPRDADVVL